MRRFVNNLLMAASLGLTLASASLATAAGHGGGRPAMPMTRPSNPGRTAPHGHPIEPNQRNLHDPRWYGRSYPYFGYYGFGYAVDPDFVMPVEVGSSQAVDNAAGANAATPQVVSHQPTGQSQTKSTISVKKPAVTAAPAPEDNFRKASSCLWIAKTFAAGNRPEKAREYALKAIKLAPDTSTAREASELLDSVKE